MEKIAEKEAMAEPLTKEYINLYGKHGGIPELLNEFYNYLLNNYSRNTALNYRSRVITMLKTIKQENPKITPRIIMTFLDDKTVTYHSAVKVFLHFLDIFIDKRFTKIEYPKVKKYEEKIVVVIGKDKIDKIIKYLPEEFKFLTMFIYKCGLRISEPYSLVVGDINWSEWFENKEKHGIIIIRKTKSNKERQIPINPIFMKEIYEYVLKRDEDVILTSYLFGRNREKYYRRKRRKLKKKDPLLFDAMAVDGALKDNIENWMVHSFMSKEKKAFSRAFTIASKEALAIVYTPHTLRKSRATHMLKAGVPLLEVSNFLGHSDIKTTMRYLFSDINDLSSSMAKLGL